MKQSEKRPLSLNQEKSVNEVESINSTNFLNSIDSFNVAKRNAQADLIEPVARANAELKIQTQAEFEPLVEMPNASLKNLVKFSQLDQQAKFKANAQAWQSKKAAYKKQFNSYYGEVGREFVQKEVANAAPNSADPAHFATALGNANRPLTNASPASFNQKVAATTFTDYDHPVPETEAKKLDLKPLTSPLENLNSSVQPAPFSKTDHAVQRVYFKQPLAAKQNELRLQQPKVAQAQAKTKNRFPKRKTPYILSAVLFLCCLLLVGAVYLFYRQQQTPMNFAKRLAKYQEAIILSSRQTGVWPSVTAAQLFLEAGDGPNELADLDNNGFGLKWHPNMALRHPNAAWPVKYKTQEYLQGVYQTIEDQFAKFADFETGIWEHDRIWWNGYHIEAQTVLMDLEHGTREQFIEGITHYATDPQYREAIKKTIKEQHLDYLDELAFPGGKRLQAGFYDLQVRMQIEAAIDYYEAALQELTVKGKESQLAPTADTVNANAINDASLYQDSTSLQAQIEELQALTKKDLSSQIAALEQLLARDVKLQEICQKVAKDYYIKIGEYKELKAH